MTLAERRFLVMAGGTGGHIYPGLSVAARLRAEGAEVEWLGTPFGLEVTLVPQAGFKLHTIDVRGLRGRGAAGWLMAPFTLARALRQALAAVRRVQPHAVLGMGGFAAGPGGVAAWLMRCPLVIHEQNARPGLTNRLLARLARRVLEAFPGSFEAGVSAVHVGNPVRDDICAVPEMEQAPVDEVKLLVLGGSQGARFLNVAVPLALASVRCGVKLGVVHQCGAEHEAAARAAYAHAGVDAQVLPYIDDMATAFAASHLVVARAGAMTVSELCACGRPAVLVPFPYAVDDHQSANAAFMVAAGAAQVVKQDPQAGDEAGADALRESLQILLDEPSVLKDMASAARRLRRADATASVVAHLDEVAS